jgi:hypothetical protein
VPPWPATPVCGTITLHVPVAATAKAKASPVELANAAPEATIPMVDSALEVWHKEILNHHRTGASNGPTEGLNFSVKQLTRAGRGFSSFKHYRLRVLLHAGGVTWPRNASPPRIRTRPPQLAAWGRIEHLDRISAPQGPRARSQAS